MSGVQTSAFAEWVRLWRFIDGDEVHVYDLDLELFMSEEEEDPPIDP